MGLQLCLLFVLKLLLYHHIVFSHCSSVQTSSSLSYLTNNTSPDSTNSKHNTVTASITRRLAFPNFKDEEKTDALTLLGSAAIDRSSGAIKIPGIRNNATTFSPQELAFRSGRALYSFPFRMVDADTGSASSFNTTFSFRIEKLGDYERDESQNSSVGGGGGGLTFLIAPDELTLGRHGGWLGLLNDACDDSYKPFAVEFDTFKNEEFHDPNDHHVGINIGSIVSHDTADASSAGVPFNDGSVVRAWISYDSRLHIVNVSIAKEGSTKPASPLLSSRLDLSEIFKEYMFVGFSGGTGSAAQVHNILSWHFSSDTTGTLRMPNADTCLTRLVAAIPGSDRPTPSAFIIFCLFILVLGLGIFNLVCMSWTKVGKGHDLVSLPKLRQERPRPVQKPRPFTLVEVLQATRVFSETEVLGNGMNGMFFKGVLPDGSQVAVKRFYPSSVARSGSYQTRTLQTIKTLSNLHHPNLVPLRGWCIVKGETLLVYDYMPNGSLDQWLFYGGTIFPWIRRYKVVKEIASALAYMHTRFKKPILHGNLKLSNVLLDISFRARIGDFDFANSWRFGQPPRTTTWSKPLKFAPTHMWHDVIKEDVYNFGVMLLEIVSGKASSSVVSKIKNEQEQCEVEGEESKEEGLVEWIWRLHEKGRVMETIDEEMNMQKHGFWEVEVALVLSVGLLCTLVEASSRPSMSMVAKYLNGEERLPNIPNCRLRAPSDCICNNKYHLQPIHCTSMSCT